MVKAVADKPESKLEAKPESKPDSTPAAKPESKNGSKSESQGRSENPSLAGSRETTGIVAEGTESGRSAEAADEIWP